MSLDKEKDELEFPLEYVVGNRKIVISQKDVRAILGQVEKAGRSYRGGELTLGQIREKGCTVRMPNSVLEAYLDAAVQSGKLIKTEQGTYVLPTRDIKPPKNLHSRGKPSNGKRPASRILCIRIAAGTADPRRYQNSKLPKVLRLY